MRIRAFMLAAVLPGCVVPPADLTMRAGHSLAEAESAFAAHSVREDMRAAFIAHFAEDGVFTRNAWVVARAWLEPRPAPPIVLDWRPAYVEVAASGDFGLSTGPWKLTSKVKPEMPPSYGQFISIWKRAPGAPWKVAVDLGISHPEPVLWGEPLQVAERTASRVAQSIVEAEQEFARTVRDRGLRAAYGAHASASVRFYRPDTPPALGSAALAGREIPEARDTSWNVERAETASSGDLGYARGSYASVGPPPATGQYLRVWRAEGGRWRIALDVINPATPR